MSSNDAIRKRITDKIIKLLDQDIIPWQRMWETGQQTSLFSQKPYRGINQLLLHIAQQEMEYKSHWWMTIRTAKEKYQTAPKEGERGHSIIFWKPRYLKEWDEQGNEIERFIPIMKEWTVFNTDQFEPFQEPPCMHRAKLSAGERYANAEDIFQLYMASDNHPEVEFDYGGRACYSPNKDKVKMPEFENFQTPSAYYSTLFHELAHSTGHHTRLKRFPPTYESPTTEAYSKEELIAEFAAAFMCAQSGIDNQQMIVNQAAYIKGWKAKLKESPYLLVSATQAAQKASDLIQGTTFSAGDE